MHRQSHHHRKRTKSRFRHHPKPGAVPGTLQAAQDTSHNEPGTLVVPDILANAGGVTVSYFEWVQNKTKFQQLRHQACERNS